MSFEVLIEHTKISLQKSNENTEVFAVVVNFNEFGLLPNNFSDHSHA